VTYERRVHATVLARSRELSTNTSHSYLDYINGVGSHWHCPLTRWQIFSKLPQDYILLAVRDLVLICIGKSSVH
jgi:hypothetical protein